MNTIFINGQDLTLEQLVAVARNNCKVQIDDDAKGNVIRSREIVEDIVKENKVVYGITTGFGKFSNVSISNEDCKTLQ